MAPNCNCIVFWTAFEKMVSVSSQIIIVQFINSLMIDRFQTQDLEIHLDCKSLEQWCKTLSACFQSWQFNVQSLWLSFAKKIFRSRHFFVFPDMYLLLTLSLFLLDLCISLLNNGKLCLGIGRMKTKFPKSGKNKIPPNFLQRC